MDKKNEWSLSSKQKQIWFVLVPQNHLALNWKTKGRGKQFASKFILSSAALSFENWLFFSRLCLCCRCILRSSVDIWQLRRKRPNKLNTHALLDCMHFSSIATILTVLQPRGWCTLFHEKGFIKKKCFFCKGKAFCSEHKPVCAWVSRNWLSPKTLHVSYRDRYSLHFGECFRWCAQVTKI